MKNGYNQLQLEKYKSCKKIVYLGKEVIILNMILLMKQIILQMKQTKLNLIFKFLIF